MDGFAAYLVEKSLDGQVAGRLTRLARDDLDAGEVTIRVHYSSINYKDALAATGAGRIIRRFPCIAGIDLAGEICDSADPRFHRGQQVIVTSFDLGVSHHGGFAELACVPADWVAPLPEGLTMFESMALGTAGFAAALGIMRMEQNGLASAKGPVVVTGATGGVGGLAIDMLARLGYRVVALTGKAHEAEYLRSLGANDVMLTADIDWPNVRPMERGLWAGAVDNVGGRVLHWVLATMKQAGTVASVGNAASPKLDTTVFPLILRGVSLLGVDSAYIGFPARQHVWDRLASDLKPTHLENVTRTIELHQLPDAFNGFIAGNVRGRTVVRVRG